MGQWIVAIVSHQRGSRGAIVSHDKIALKFAATNSWESYWILLPRRDSCAKEMNKTLALTNSVHPKSTDPSTSSKDFGDSCDESLSCSSPFQHVAYMMYITPNILYDSP